MQRASQSLGQPGEGQQAAEAQREATAALNEAQQASEEGVQPATEEQRQAAAELAAEQERLRQQMLELARRNEERNDAADQQALERAQQSAQRAQQSLQSASSSSSSSNGEQQSPQDGGAPPEEQDPESDLSEAQDEERQVEQALDDALEELEEEEEQYQRLRQEELLFQIKDEVEGMLTAHREQMEALVEADSGREQGGRVSRRTRITLRAIAREEEAVAARATKVADALEAEGVLVFHEIVRTVEGDLVRIVRDLGETGGYQSGARVQAMQQDVENALSWLQEALEEEMQRREEEQQEQEQEDQQQQDQQQQDQEEALVPDAAELRLLRKLEEDLLGRVQRLQDLHPELEDPEAELDPLLLEELTRMAYQHQRIGELFQQFRQRLGVPDPD